MSVPAMKLPAKTIFFLLALALPALTGQALTWTAHTITVSTAPFQTTQDATFAFQNTSDRPVTITDIQTTCECLTAATDQKTYAPGARGLLTGLFTVGDRFGLYQRAITVLTDESDTPTRLVLEINVPALATLTPQSLVWHLADSPAEKAIEIKPAEGLTIDFTVVEITNDSFSARLETVVAGQHYRLHVTPVRPGEAANAALRVHGRAKSGQDVLVSAYANVR
jgi:Protein of unknown function (DUF1573)